jgi:hypothetical protein
MTASDSLALVHQGLTFDEFARLRLRGPME